IKVNIQSRNTATVPVEVRLSSKTLNGSYQVGTPKAALEKVQITGAKSEVQQVAKVIAYVNVPKNAQSTLHRTVTLQAINESGQTMNVVIMPNTVSVTVPISQTDSGDKNSSSSATTSSAITQSNSDSSAESASASSAKHSSASSASGSQSNNSSVSASENDTK
ncbi:MAG: CdaR family protein, partial [Limosilactobacillus mucosae]